MTQIVTSAQLAMLRPALLLVALASLSAGEYVWTGTEWKWQEPDTAGGVLPPSSTSLGGGHSANTDTEGSGAGNTWDDDYDDEDYDDNYTYDDDYEEPAKKKKEDKKKFSFSDNNKKNKKKNKNKNRNSEILPATDDEDLFEGSGASDFDLPRSNYPESNNNNYNNFNNPVTSVVDPYNTADNSNVYVDENDDSYDDEYDYDDEDYDDDISFGSDNSNYGNNFAETTAKPMDPVINMNNVNNNVWNTPKPTERSFTPRSTTTSKPVSHGAGAGGHKVVPVGRPASFFAQPGILAAVIGGAVVGLLCAILLVMFIVYRMRKKDEGSYALDEPKRSHNVNSYSKPPNREFYA